MSIFGIIGLILLFLGLNHRDTYFIVPSGIIFTILGTLLFFYGFEYPVGVSISDMPDGSTQISNIYATFRGGNYSDYGFSYFIFLVGVYCFYLPIEWMNQRKKIAKSRRHYSEEGE